MSRERHRDDVLGINDAEDVWNIAHTIALSEQNVKTMSIGEGLGGCGDSRHYLDWASTVRKLVIDDTNTRILDAMYGDSQITPTPELRDKAQSLLKKFMFSLRDKPDVYKDYHKFRYNLYG